MNEKKNTFCAGCASPSTQWLCRKCTPQQTYPSNTFRRYIKPRPRPVTPRDVKLEQLENLE